MSLRDDLNTELDALPGGTGWVAVQSSRPFAHVRLDVTRVESIGCEIASITVSARSIAGIGVDALTDWSERLSGRLTYLLESLVPLEVDEENGELLLRSGQPQATPGGCEYYELLLAAAGTDSVRLARYRSESGVPGRDAVEMLLTRETVGRLVDDLISTMP